MGFVGHTGSGSDLNTEIGLVTGSENNINIDINIITVVVDKSYIYNFIIIFP